MATHSPVEIRAESHKPAWSQWTPVHGGWMRRRPSVPGMNDHWGKWSLNRDHNQRFRFNPASNGTHIETAKEEFQFHLNDHNQVSVMSQDYDAGRAVAPGWWGNEPEQYTGEQGSAVIGESGDLLVFDPDEVGQQGVDIEHSGMEAEPDERDFEQSTAAPSKSNRKHRKVTRQKKSRGQQHRASSSITPDKSALASVSGVSVACVTSASDHAVMASSSATETANAIASWIFGPIMAGIGFGTMRATQKSADATKRSAPPLGGNSSSDPPADNRDSRTGSVEARGPGMEISREQPRARNVPTAPPPAHGTALTSASVDVPQEGMPTGESPEPIDAAQTPEVTQNSGTSNGRAVPIKTIPSARKLTHSSTGMTTASMSRTSDPGQSSVNQSPPRQGSNIRTGAKTVPKETTQQKEECLRNITEVQDKLKSRKKERESELVLDKRLRELRNRLA